MEKKQTAKTRSEKIETQRRIRVIQEWILQDYASADIIHQAQSAWNITSRQAYRYLWAARKFFEEKDSASLNAKVSYYVARKKKLLRDMDPKERRTAAGVAAANKVLDSMAKLQGISMDTIKLIGDKNNPVHTSAVVESKTEYVDYSSLPTPFIEQLLKSAGKLPK